MRRAYRGLFEGFDDESLEGRLSDGSSAAELHVDEDRLCFAWKSFISDIKEDRRQREVVLKMIIFILNVAVNTSSIFRFTCK